MVQPSPSNSDNHELAKQAGVQQGLDNGSSNSGSMQGASAGGDANQIIGDSNQVTKIENLYITHTLASLLILIGKNFYQFWRNHQRLLLSLVLIPVFSGTVYLIPQVREELHIGESRCFYQARKQRKQVVAIAKFHNEAGSANTFIYNKVLDVLLKNKFFNVEICQTNKSLQNHQEAQELGKSNDLKAAVVVWSRQGGATLEVNVTAVNLNLKSFNQLKLIETNLINVGQKTQDWPTLTFLMTAYNLSKVYVNQKRFEEAASILLQGLELAEYVKLNKNNRETIEKISRGYYTLGDLYAKQKFNCANRLDICDKAIWSYNKAFEWDDSFYDALNQKGLRYTHLDKLNDALSTYTKIIDFEAECPPFFKLIARQNRANIYLKQGNLPAAIQDLEFVCQQQPSNLEVCQFLENTKTQ